MERHAVVVLFLLRILCWLGLLTRYLHGCLQFFDGFGQVCGVDYALGLGYFVDGKEHLFGWLFEHDEFACSA